MSEYLLECSLREVEFEENLGEPIRDKRKIRN